MIKEQEIKEMIDSFYKKANDRSQDVLIRQVNRQKAELLEYILEG